ncbi:glycosyltransferase family 4 protein [Carnobacterium divergens]|uniref:Glycosyltransferase family 4 protein n=1 Tax=Carnobacterium divergens TaxID=2748 RepID=A0AAW8R9H0_CARDV|nr:glycosyltransferase family 4 protein [Carnobacterium divergens]MDT1958273.1 glycosyltransferase family 4 protein [Carnobacterium divergens]MDT1973540.1 glycosyltransferase family 4 protein [Carnobacterium divergens]
MNIWIVGVGEPLPIDGENTRLRRVGNLAKYISETKDEVHWFSTSFDHYKKKQRVEQDKTVELNSNFFLHVAKVSGYKKNISFARILHHQDAAKQIKKLMEQENKPDVILAGNTPIEVVSMVVEYGKQNNVPVVIDIRDLWPEVFKEVFPNYMNVLVNPYVAWNKHKLRKTFSNATSLIGLSEGFLNYALAISKRDKNSLDTVIPIGYPNYEYNYTSSEFNKLWGNYDITTDDFIVSFTGNFGRQFSFEEIMEASNKLKYEKKIKFVLCGTGENFDKIKELAPDNVIFPGWIEKDMITSLLQYSKIGVAPYINSVNYQLNTPNKFGEYLSASLPILVSVEGEMKNRLIENSCGNSYQNGEELSNLIKGYFDNSEKLTIQSENARALFLSDFNGDIVSETIKRQLEKVAFKQID